VATMQQQLNELQENVVHAQRVQHAAEASLSENTRRVAVLQAELEAKATLEQNLGELKEKYDDQISRAQQMLQDIEANDDHLMAYVHCLSSLTKPDSKLPG
jgi:chromosome segregation ATPase